jgi:hypothetical protein
VVCTNAGLIFGVFIPERAKLLFFVNPITYDAKKALLKKSTIAPKPFPSIAKGFMDSQDTVEITPAGSLSLGSSSEAKLRSADEGRMSPSLFSTWFVKTNERMPALRDWPIYAYATWVSFQMNAISMRGDYHLTVQIPVGEEALFYDGGTTEGAGLASHGRVVREKSSMKICAQQAIRMGATRERYQSGFLRSGAGRGIGPRVGDISQFQTHIKTFLKNSRTKKRVKENLGAEMAADPKTKGSDFAVLYRDFLNDFAK